METSGETVATGHAIAARTWMEIPRTEARLRWDGRVSGAHPLFAWSGSKLEFRFRGTAAKFRFRSLKDGGMDPAGRNFYNVYVDGKEAGSHQISAGNEAIDVDGLSDSVHLVQLEKATEAQCGRDELVGLSIFGELQMPEEAALKVRRIVFFGNSITAGYGIEDGNPLNSYGAETQNASVTYAAVASRLLKASRSQICISGRGLVRNFDGTKDLLLPEFLEWTAPQDKSAWRESEPADVVVVEIGTNDFGLGDPGELAFVLAYQELVRRLMVRYPQAKIVLVDSPMLTDEWPVDPKTKQPTPSASLLQGYLAQVRGGLASAQRSRLSVFHFMPQGADVFGYGADYHPNRTQAQCNGEELAEHIRKQAGW